MTDPRRWPARSNPGPSAPTYFFGAGSTGAAAAYASARFSFNTGQGRCPGCEGQGLKTIAMIFLPDVKVSGDIWHGARFNPETLAVSWRGKSIGDVLQMEVDEAVDFFASMPAIAYPLQLL